MNCPFCKQLLDIPQDRLSEAEGFHYDCPHCSSSLFLEKGECQVLAEGRIPDPAEEEQEASQEEAAPSSASAASDGRAGAVAQQRSVSEGAAGTELATPSGAAAGGLDFGQEAAGAVAEGESSGAPQQLKEPIVANEAQNPADRIAAAPATAAAESGAEAAPSETEPADSGAEASFESVPESPKFPDQESAPASPASAALESAALAEPLPSKKDAPDSQSAGAPHSGLTFGGPASGGPHRGGPNLDGPQGAGSGPGGSGPGGSGPGGSAGGSGEGGEGETEEEKLEDFSDLERWGNRPGNTHQGPFFYNLLIEDINSQETREYVKEVLSDEGLNLPPFRIKGGSLRLPRLSPAAAHVIVKALIGRPLTLSWEQELTAEAEGEEEPQEAPPAPPANASAEKAPSEKPAAAKFPAGAASPSQDEPGAKSHSSPDGSETPGTEGANA